MAEQKAHCVGAQQDVAVLLLFHVLLSAKVAAKPTGLA